MGNYAETRRRYRASARGRVCRWCEASDADARWSQNASECARCRKQRQRSKCKRCDGPFYAWPRRDRYAGCVRCDEGVRHDLRPTLDEVRAAAAAERRAARGRSKTKKPRAKRNAEVRPLFPAQGETWLARVGISHTFPRRVVLVSWVDPLQVSTRQVDLREEEVGYVLEGDPVLRTCSLWAWVTWARTKLSRRLEPNAEAA